MGANVMIGPVAYMDPGTGSLFLQLLLGGVAGAAVILKYSWRRLLGMVGLYREETTPPEGELPEERKVEEASAK